MSSRESGFPPNPLPISVPGGDGEGAGMEIMVFRRIPAGPVRMGQRGKQVDEEPVHEVLIGTDFFLGETPVTQAQFSRWTTTDHYKQWFEENEKLIRETSLDNKAEIHRNELGESTRCPADSVTWWEAFAYAEWLTDSGALPEGWIAVLPTEAQWEHACRAGTETNYWSGNSEADLDRVGWYEENAGRQTHPVATRNNDDTHPYGLHDLHGNVWEWCLDCYDAKVYRRTVEGVLDPVLSHTVDVEPAEAPQLFVDSAEIMGRYASDDSDARVVRPEDRQVLKVWKGELEKDPNATEYTSALTEALRGSDGQVYWMRPDLAKTLRDYFAGQMAQLQDTSMPPRVLRGGSWHSTAALCRSAIRNRHAPGYRNWYYGFRLALVPGPIQSSSQAGAEPEAGGKARRDDAAVPEAGAEREPEKQEATGEENPPRSGRKFFEEMSFPMNNKKEEFIAISSVDGKSWWGREKEVPFPFPKEPNSTVSRLVLGSLESGKALTLSQEILDGLQHLRKHFPGLTHLHLWGLTNLEKVACLPDNLECLDIRECPRLTRVGDLTHPLKTLDLGDCPAVTALPHGDFSKLEYVWLNGCAALQRFSLIRNGLATIRQLELHGCRFRDLGSPLCGLPEENVLEKVRAYYAAMKKQGTVPLAECKVIVLGNGGVGKTELVRALMGKPFESDQDSTDGIRLWKWDGDGCAPFPDVEELQMNIWDFGGQDLYHNTHRLFLESRAVFVVVDRALPECKYFRENHKEDPVRPPNYWIDQVRAANPAAPILLVRTGIDIQEDAERWEPFEDRIRPDYHNLLPAFEVSSRRKEKAGEGWNKFRAALLEAVKGELGGAEAVQVPKGWAAMREKLGKWQPSCEEGSDDPDSKRPLLRQHEYSVLAKEIFSITNWAHLPLRWDPC